MTAEAITGNGKTMTNAATYNYTDDRNNYLESLDYGNGDKVQYTYDSKGRVTAETYEDGDTVTYKYDNDGALAKVTDSATGRTTTYYYDFTDRLMKQVESGSGYSHAVSYQYDTINNLTQMVETINGVDHTTSYTYDDDNRVESVTTDGVTVEYTYDALGRVSQQVTKNSETTILTESFTYTEPAENTTSSQIATYTTAAPNGYSVTYTYTYDNNGNITSISDGTDTVSYVYDSANQLIQENVGNGSSVNEWIYDSSGNVTMFDWYTDLGFGVSVEFKYEDSTWGDLLTSNGSAITYDGVGNMLSDGTRTYTWEHGRQLATATKSGTTWRYTYNTDGLRTGKTNGTDTYSYVYNGSQLTGMTKGTDTLHFTYDANGVPVAVTYNGTVYYYATNIQGDIVAILDSTGTAVVTYSYDAWGNANTPAGTMASTLGALNPLRYRGYVYDNETGLYYLQSRYYNPGLFRFINADAFVSTGQGLLGNNMFVYCNNSPVIFADYGGTRCVQVSSQLSGGGQYVGSAPDYIAIGKKLFDIVVQTATALAFPTTSILNKNLHYARNTLNNTNYEETDLIEQGITKEPPNADKFHQNNQKNNERNRKYVIGDWCSSEIVYYADGTINNTPEDVGTFNVYSGDNPFLNFAVHGVFDVLPYMLWGNNKEDSTTIIDRVIMIWE